MKIAIPATLPRLRTLVATGLAVACAALGSLSPRWSYALYQMGYYGENAHAASAADAWEHTAQQLARFGALCASHDIPRCADRVELAARNAIHLAEEYRALANDPPDSNYTAIDLPEIQLLPMVSSPGTSRPFNAAWFDLYTNQARTVALLNAFVSANERAQGARLARAANWAQTQGQLAALYANELASLTAAEPALAARAVAAWHQAGLAPIDAGDGTIYPDLLSVPTLDRAALDFSAAMADGAATGVLRVPLVVLTKSNGGAGVAMGTPAIKLALLSTPGLDAAAINPATLRFGPDLAHAARRGQALIDANDDGQQDLVVRFAGAGAHCGDTFVVLGSTFDGRAIGGLAYARPEGCRD